jgi:hypothetical protein
MKVAAGGGSGGPHPGNDLPHPHGVALLDRDRLQVVIRGDEAVAVVDFHPIAAAPRVPPHGPHHTGVGGVNPGAARRREVLAPVELARVSRQGAGAQPERGRRHERFQRGHEETVRGPAQGRRGHIELPAHSFPGDRVHRAPAEGQERQGVSSDSAGSARSGGRGGVGLRVQGLGPHGAGGRHGCGGDGGGRPVGREGAQPLKAAECQNGQGQAKASRYAAHGNGPCPG